MSNLNLIYEYMYNKMCRYEHDRNEVINRVSLHRLSSDDYYDLLVTEIREDTAREIFRTMKELLNTYVDK